MDAALLLGVVRSVAVDPGHRHLFGSLNLENSHRSTLVVMYADLQLIMSQLRDVTCLPGIPASFCKNYHPSAHSRVPMSEYPFVALRGL